MILDTLYLCGAGNAEGIRLALQINRAAKRWRRIVLLDDDGGKLGKECLGLAVAGGFDRLESADPAKDEVLNLVTRTTDGRARARERIAAYGIPFASAIHPGVDDFGVALEQEVTVYANASLGAGAALARSCVVLTGAVVGHGSSLGAGCVVAPNAVINARVVLGERVYVGSNASILPDLRIGAGATIAANSLVIDDVPAGATALGVPAAVAGHSAAHEASAASAGLGDPSELEAAVTAAIEHVLSLKQVPATANFFDLGGTSVKAVVLCQHLKERLGLPAHPLDVFRYPSAASLARHFAGGRTAGGAVLAGRNRARMRSDMTFRS
jgi:acetyltransferase-like isoleucine patch superfamily enzyme